MEKVVLYGAGLVAKALLAKKLEFEVAAITDSNEKLWGSDWAGYPVLPPDAVDFSQCDKIVIATLDYYDEIKEQLVNEYCMKEEKIEKVSAFYARTSESNSFPHQLGVAMIIRNGSEYLDEWICYHILIGISHFYIYDNESTDGLKGVLDKWIKKGIVTYIFYPGDCIQMEAYNHAIAHFQNDVKYLAIIDSDEFIAVTDRSRTLPEVIEEIEAKYELSMDERLGGSFGGVALNWRIYGTSNHKVRQSGLVIENYTWRGKDDVTENALVKTICNPRRVERFPNPHAPIYKKGYCGISEKGSFVIGSMFFDGMCSKLRVNHYHSKSEEELREKFKRGWPDQEHHDVVDAEVEKRIWQVRKNHNAVEDRILADYADEVRRMMESVKIY